MKKFILTGCAVALFSIGTMAQVQDTASINNNLRQDAQETEQNVDSASNELQQGAERTGEQIEQGAERTGDQIQQSADSAGNEIQQGAERTGDQIQQGVEQTGDQIENRTDDATDKTDQDRPSAQGQGQDGNVTGTDNSVSSANAAPQSEIEVLEDKEGPNNQVVYKYQGGLYYVDKEEKKLVKIEESQLKDAEHKAIISDNN
jgi:hypothetical protein